MPPGCAPDLWEGAAALSLVGVEFSNVVVKGISWPWHDRFPEVNLRTYVQGPNGPGVVFLGEMVPKFLAAWMARSWDWSRRFVQVVTAMVAAGAVGNLIDRVRLGYVLDFFDFHVRGWSWPAFNIADACISVGVGLLVLSWLSGKTPEKNLD